MIKNIDFRICFSVMTILTVLVGLFQSWGIALSMLNLCLISAVMAMGVNIQWGFAGLINFGVMGFLAIGGLATVLVSVPPVHEAWSAGGIGILISGLFLAAVVISVFMINKKLSKHKYKNYFVFLIIILSIPLLKFIAGPSISKIESINAATSGFLGGANLPIIFSWFVGAILSALVAFVVGKVCLGLRSDYLAISTLLVSGIIITIVKHEEWLSRGVKNVIGLKRPVPYEINLQVSDWFINMVTWFNSSKLNQIIDPDQKQQMLNNLIIDSSSLFVKLNYAILFFTVMVVIYYFANKAQISPWGRMMRAIRDNEVSANAMGKDIVKQHLIIFVIGAAIVGVAGAMLVTLDGLFTPSGYRPLRFTFIIWIMVIVGGSGNNLGAIFGGFVIWFAWIEVAPLTTFLINIFTSGLDPQNAIRLHLLDSVPYFRYLLMGMVLLLILRYRPKGIIPEKVRHS